jgi:hypothetical protein
MKIFLIDTEDGLIDVLTEEELLEDYSKERLEEIKSNPNNTVRELPYTLKQYQRAKRLRDDDKWIEKFEDEYMFSPDVRNILEHLYN